MMSPPAVFSAVRLFVFAGDVIVLVEVVDRSVGYSPERVRVFRTVSFLLAKE
jgi:hypothetical protein